jgi:hypothetical protein
VRSFTHRLADDQTAITERGGQHPQMFKRLIPVHQRQIGVPEDDLGIGPASLRPQRSIVTVQAAADRDDDRRWRFGIGWWVVLGEQPERKLIASTHGDLLC